MTFKGTMTAPVMVSGKDKEMILCKNFIKCNYFCNVFREGYAKSQVLWHLKFLVWHLKSL